MAHGVSSYDRQVVAKIQMDKDLDVVRWKDYMQRLKMNRMKGKGEK